MNTFKKIGLFICIGIIGVVFGVVATMQWPNLDAADDNAHEHPLTKINGYIATCQETGAKDYWECPDCEKYFADADGLVEIKATDLAEWKVVKKADHLTNEHHHVDEVKANCAQAGNMEYYSCMYCGDYFEDANCIIPVGKDFVKYPKTTQHEIVAVKAVTAKCYQDGMAAHYECQVCGQKYIDKDGETTTTAEALKITVDHDLVHVAAVEATCTADGNIEYYECSNAHCNFKSTDEKGFEPVENVTTTKNHELNHHAATEADCENAGNHAYYECEICHGTFADENAETPFADYVIKAEGHNHVEVLKAEQTEPRQIVYENRCTKCNHFNGESTLNIFAENNAAVNGNTLALDVFTDQYANTNTDILFDLYILDWNNSQKENNGQTIKIALVLPDVIDNEKTAYHYNGQTVQQVLSTLVINYEDIAGKEYFEWHFDWNGDGYFDQTIRVDVINY